jgi:hypothetical protein
MNQDLVAGGMRVMLTTVKRREGWRQSEEIRSDVLMQAAME